MAIPQPFSQAKPISWLRTLHKYADALLLLLVLAFAAYLRFAVLDYGLPFIYGDENPIVEHSLGLSLKDMNPHTFFYGSLPFYIFKVVSISFDGVNRLLTFTMPTFSDHVLVLRYFSALSSFITIGLIYILGRKLAGGKVGLLSAAVFTLSPEAIDRARMATVDALLGMWAALALVGLVMWLHGDLRGRTLAAVATGLAVSTKFNASIFLVSIFLIALQKECDSPARILDKYRKNSIFVFVFVSILAYTIIIASRDYILHVVASWSTRGYLLPSYIAIFDSLLRLGLVAVIVGIFLSIGVLCKWRWSIIFTRTMLGYNFLCPLMIVCAILLLTSPYIILDFPTFIRDLFFQVRHVASPNTVAYDVDTRSYQAAAEVAASHNFLQYTIALRDEWGIPIFLMLPVGALSIWRSMRIAFLPFISLCVLMLLATMGWNYLAIRYLYPLWPIFAILAGAGVYMITMQISNRIHQKYIKMAVMLPIVVVILGIPMVSSLDRLKSNYLLPDTRTQAFVWIEKNVSPGEVILREMVTPNLESLSSKYRVYATDTAFEEAPLSEWRRRGVTVILLSDWRYQFYRDHATEFQDVLRNYDEVMTKWSLAQSFAPSESARGALVQVYTLP